MIHYSIDTEPRSKVHFYAAAIALAFALGIPHVMQQVSARVLVPSAFATYALLLLVFNRWLWKMWPFSLVSGVPNIAGKYKGSVTRDSGSTTPQGVPVEAVITQTWTRIEMSFISANTVSYLTLCGFCVENEDAQRLLSSYTLKERVPKDGVNNYGEGSQEFRIETKGTLTLSGRYYSTKGRSGFISIQRSERPVT